MSDKQPIGWNVYEGSQFREFIPNDQEPGPAEALLNAFADAMTMVVRDILDAGAAVAEAVRKALEENHG